MGWFRRKNKDNKVLNISGKQLEVLLNAAVNLAIEDIETRCYIVGPEIMLEYNDNVHFMGVKYDRKRAKKEKRTSFSSKLMSVYLDREEYPTITELFNNATMEEKLLRDIENNIIVSTDYKSLLYKM